ncbi:hypothetical protein BU17DRAFT_68399 [Hysterangium stoloniferum]|nr:hypothetical protein BU17DRAFT_68399 [Hysterangium stoloniferum]
MPGNLAERVKNLEQEVASLKDRLTACETAHSYCTKTLVRSLKAIAELRERVGALERRSAQHDPRGMKSTTNDHRHTPQGADSKLAADKEIKSYILSNNNLKVMVERLQTQIIDLEHSKRQDNSLSMALALIDGDGNIFRSELVKRGPEGGIEAAKALTDSIVAYCRKEEPWKDGSPVDLWVHIFLNARGLRGTLLRCGICTSGEFEGFIVGLSQANPRLIVTDVHPGKDAADIKIKEYLSFYAQSSQTWKVFFGGTHDNGYVVTLTDLQDKGLLDKVVLLKGYECMTRKIESLRLPTLKIKRLFMSERLPAQKASVDIGKTISPTSSPVNIRTDINFSDDSMDLERPAYPNRGVFGRMRLSSAPSTLYGKRRSLGRAIGQGKIYLVNSEKTVQWVMCAHFQTVLAYVVNARFEEDCHPDPLISAERPIY